MSYMRENENKVYIDVNEMADSLQKRYKDYRGKKRGPFRAMVRKAYDELTELFSRKPQMRDPPAYDEDYEDEVDIESDSQHGAISDMLLHMYKKSQYKRNGNSSDKELIDISSDDDASKTKDESKAGKDIKKAETICNAAEKPLQISSMVVQKLETPISKPETSISKLDIPIPKLQTPTNPKKSETPANGVIKQLSVELTRKRQREKENNNGQFTVAKKAKTVPITESKITFSNIGGSEKVLKTVCTLLAHMKHPEIFKKLGISPLRGFLLHGPPGCGKTLLAHAVAGELNLPLLKVAAPELIAGVSGESEARIRELFDQALALAPSIIFLDEIDAIAPHRATAQREMERRIVAQLLSCLDELNLKENGSTVLVIGATNRPDSLDPALRRAGRFDREVCLGMPDRDARARILAVHTEKVTLAPNVNLSTIASLTPGFVGADLVALIREAAMAAVNRVFEDLNKLKQHEKSSEVIEIDNQLGKEGQTVENSLNIVDISDVIETSTSAIETSTSAIEVSTKTVETPMQAIETLKEATETLIEAVEISTETTETPMEAVETSMEVVKTSVEAIEITSADAKSNLEKNLPENSSPMEMDGIQEPSKSLDLLNLLTWLHNEPPLSPEHLSTLCVEYNDFETALRVVQPSAKREGFATVPDVTWDDIGSLQDIRQELQMAILAPVRHFEYFNALGLTAPTGILLCGPPGCGKTLLAKAIANEAGINFISVKGPELLNMYVGESEKAVRQCFSRARNSAPCVIFFDELDALCPKRTEGDNSSTSRVVNQMLTEMDGVEGRQGVFLMAASNRPDIIDPAVLRPGRLDKILYVGLPTASDRVDILHALTKNATKPKLATDVDLIQIGYDVKCEGFTGADLAALIREAGMEALKEAIIGNVRQPKISRQHIVRAFDKVQPSVREKDIKHYKTLSKLYSVKKNSKVTPMETPANAPIADIMMEPMET